MFFGLVKMLELNQVITNACQIDTMIALLKRGMWPHKLQKASMSECHFREYLN